MSISLQSKAIRSYFRVRGTGKYPPSSGKLTEVGQNHDARTAVSGTLSVLKCSGAIFRPKSSKVSVQKVVLCPFYCKTRPSRLSLASKGLENIPQVPENLTEVGQNYDGRKCGLGYSFTLKVKWSYISAQKLKSERSKSCVVSILLQTKDVGGQFRVPGTGKYLPSSGKFNRSWSKSRRTYGGLGYSFSLKMKWGNI